MQIKVTIYECEECFCLLPFLGALHNCPNADSSEAESFMQEFNELLDQLTEFERVTGEKIIEIVEAEL